MQELIPNAMAPDAPLVALLSKANLLGKTPDELRAIVKQCRTYVAQPQSLSAKLNAEAKEGTGRGPSKSVAKTAAMLKTLDDLGL